VSASHQLTFLHCCDDSELPLLCQEGHRTLGATLGTALDHISYTKVSEVAMTMTPANIRAGSYQHQQYPALPSLVPLVPSSQTLDWGGLAGSDDVLCVMPVPAPPLSRYKLRPLFC
jgi:hypothetical protein